MEEQSRLFHTFGGPLLSLKQVIGTMRRFWFWRVLPDGGSTADQKHFKTMLWKSKLKLKRRIQNWKISLITLCNLVLQKISEVNWMMFKHDNRLDYKKTSVYREYVISLFFFQSQHWHNFCLFTKTKTVPAVHLKAQMNY